MTNLDTIFLKAIKNAQQRGNVFVISGPSGVGKGTLISMLIKKHPEIVLSVSATTRKPRAGEVNGINYLFTPKERFEEMIETDEFLEWANFAGNYYGTCRSIVEQTLFEGRDIALEIDVKGALQVKEKLPGAILIFILPPSIKELESRLFKRKTDSEEEIKRRLSIVESEINKKGSFNYEIVNDNLEKALQSLEGIILAERCKVTNVKPER